MMFASSHSVISESLGASVSSSPHPAVDPREWRNKEEGEEDGVKERSRVVLLGG